MRHKLILLCCALLLATASANATISCLVQTIGCHNNSSVNPFTCSVSSTGSGNLIWIFLRSGTGSDHGTTVTDNASGGSNTYTQIGTAQTDGSVGYTAQFYVKNSRSGATTISLAYNGNYTFNTLTGYECSGVDTSSPLDISDKGTAGTNSITSNSFTTAQAHEVVFMGDGISALSQTFQVGPIGGTNADAVNTEASGDAGSEYRVTSSVISSGTANIKIAAGSQNSNYGVASFKEASAATGFVKSGGGSWQDL